MKLTPKNFASADMVLVTQKLQRNFHLPFLQLEVGICHPFPFFSNPSSQSNIKLQGPVDDFNDLEKLSVLGRGNHGIVYKVRHRPTSAIYALKMFKEDIINTPCLSQEPEILTCTDSPFVIKCHGIFEPRAGEKAILMEYIDGGTVDTVLRSNAHHPLAEALVAQIALQVLSGLSYLHACNIVHLDIKPSNLLVTKDMKVKIADFGVSKIMVRGGTDTTNRHFDDLGSQGTYAYMSPERLDSQTFDATHVYAGDVWSLGVTLWELYVGHYPFFPPGKRPNWIEIMMAICFGEFPSLPKQASQEFRSFLMCCLDREPSKRWTVCQLLSHPFVSMEGA